MRSYPLKRALKMGRRFTGKNKAKSITSAEQWLSE